MPCNSMGQTIIAILGMALVPSVFSQQLPASSEAADISASQEPASEAYAVHGQTTFLEQLASAFHAPYSGQNSLSPRHGAETFDMTLFLGARLWSGAEAWVNPEIDQGFGLDDTLGVAGFPSGTAYKVGRSHPYCCLLYTSRCV